MYATCLHCHGRLGRNDAIASVPVGRRIAYDRARGRVWVVCRRCGGWNIVPLDDPFAAAEECERSYRLSTSRVGSEAIALARLRSGVTLVRVGGARLPEYAAWRYGERVTARRWAQARRLGLAFGGSGVILATGAYRLLAVIPGALPISLVAVPAWMLFSGRRKRRRIAEQVVCTLDDATGRRPALRVAHLGDVELCADGDHGWAIRVAHADGIATLRPPEAQRVLGYLLPWMNAMGGSKAELREAVRLVQSAGGPAAIFPRLARAGPRAGAGRELVEGGLITDYTTPMRLALEICAHEESERALSGRELERLTADWRAADETAGVVEASLT